VSFAFRVSFCVLAFAFSRWLSSLTIKALLVLRSSLILKSGCVVSMALSFSRLCIFEVILWYVFFCWLVVMFLIFDLKIFYRSCGLFSSVSVFVSFSLSMSSCSLMLHFITLLIIIWSSICVSG